MNGSLKENFRPDQEICQDSAPGTCPTDFQTDKF
jgi:hypothetical protein